MRARLIEHALSILFVTIMLVGISLVLNGSPSETPPIRDKLLTQLIPLAQEINFHSPFEKLLLIETMNVYYPGNHDANVAQLDKLEQWVKAQKGQSLLEAPVREHLTMSKALSISAMFLKFLLVYILVMALTWYGVQTVAVWRFVKRKHRGYDQNKTGLHSPLYLIRSLLRQAGTGIGTFILFCPAYVIAYSIRTEFGTDSLPFMVLLGAMSNGILLVYANKFYAFLVAEGRKGYVETAMAKNLSSDWSTHSPRGVRLSAILKWRKRFDGHVLGHIFKNAQQQYLSSIKEQACFLITGLVIVEMALNIHGHLNYELLRQLLYKNYDIVTMIILCIFYTVKSTEIVVDWLSYRTSLIYGNGQARI